MWTEVYVDMSSPNELPNHIKAVESVQNFNTQLKTLLFDSSL